MQSINCVEQLRAEWICRQMQLPACGNGMQISPLLLLFFFLLLLLQPLHFLVQLLLLPLGLLLLIRCSCSPCPPPVTIQLLCGSVKLDRLDVSRMNRGSVELESTGSQL